MIFGVITLAVLIFVAANWRNLMSRFSPGPEDSLNAEVGEQIVESVAASNGAEAEMTLGLGYPVTVNDPALTRQMVPSLRRVAGDGLIEGTPRTGAEDFSYFAQEAPGLFISLGVGSDDLTLVHPNHSPYFYADERALPIGVRAMASLAVDYLMGRPISDD